MLVPALAFAQAPAGVPTMSATAVNNTAPAASASTPLPPLASDVPPMPAGKVTLLGGTIRKLDLVSDQMTVEPFGGGKQLILFDVRTKVTQGAGQTASLTDLKIGQRIYVDTMLDGKTIFARNIRVSSTAQGQSGGQVVAFDQGAGELTLRDPLSNNPIRMHVVPETQFVGKDKPASAADLRPGTLVSLNFGPDSKGRPVVRQVSILATPGSQFVFSGKLIHLDRSRGLLVLLDPRDQKTYDIHFDDLSRRMVADLREGVSLTVNAKYDGSVYTAREITVDSASENQQ
jgi:hypothetical protein